MRVSTCCIPSKRFVSVETPKVLLGRKTGTYNISLNKYGNGTRINTETAHTLDRENRSKKQMQSPISIKSA